LVTNTAGIQDYGLNQHTWEGMQQAREDKTVDHIAYIESIDSRDYLKNIQFFAQNGYDIIITIGPALDDETLRAADQYPDSVFMGMDQPQKETRPNLLPILFPEDQMGFWAGALAAHLTKTGVVGAACETSGIDSMWRYCEGFRKGAAYADENVKALIVYRDDQSSDKLFIDSEWGQTTAQDLIQRGADVIFAAGGGTAQGALLAAAEAGVQAIGAERDQAHALPEAAQALATSVYGRADLEVQKWIRSIRDGSTWEGAAEGAFGYVPYRNIGQPLPNSVKTEMDQLLQGLLTKEVETQVPKKAP
jgi:basic membrane protein A